MAISRYIGRFAPSPSGPLHFGSLVAAVGSYLQARVAGGDWLLRIEDLDTPRVVPHATDEIIRTLESFGFEWSGAVEYQSRRIVGYTDSLAELQRRGDTYPCSCSRAQIAAIDDQRYPGTCLLKAPRSGEPVAQRFLVHPGKVAFVDRIQGRFEQDVAATYGDFVVQRRDQVFAYHLAVVVDDASQGVTEVVRGADLLDSTPRHLLLQRALGVATPDYCHLPLAVDAEGQKLSKSSQSLAADANQAPDVLWHALAFLRQSPPLELRRAAVREIWFWAFTHWTLCPLRQVKSDRAPAAR